MKRRYVYVMLFGVPALLAALILSLLLFGAAAGVLWIFVYGDTPWPNAAGNALTTMLVLTCVTLWAVFLSVAYVAGKRQEGARDPERPARDGFAGRNGTAAGACRFASVACGQHRRAVR